jgi:hypothetical protein
MQDPATAELIGGISLDRFTQIRGAVRSQNSANSLERVCAEYMLLDPTHVSGAVEALAGALDPSLKITAKELASALQMAFYLTYKKTMDALGGVL